MFVIFYYFPSEFLPHWKQTKSNERPVRANRRLPYWVWLKNWVHQVQVQLYMQVCLPRVRRQQILRLLQCQAVDGNQATILCRLINLPAPLMISQVVNNNFISNSGIYNCFSAYRVKWRGFCAVGSIRITRYRFANFVLVGKNQALILFYVQIEDNS